MTSAAKPTLGMILKGYPRISETFISNEILLLEQLGIPIRIFSMRLPRESFCHESVKQIQAPVDYLPTDLFLDFKRLFWPMVLQAVNDPAIFLSTLAKAAQRFKRTHSLGTPKHLMQACYVNQLLLKHSPEIVHLHSHFAHSPSSVALFSSLLSGLRFSFTAHAKDIYTSNPAQLREKTNMASQVITCTKHNVDYLKKIAEPTSTPLHCIYHGIDLDLFQPRADEDKINEPYKIMTVARLTAKKGIFDILEALIVLKEKNIDFTYTLIGDGDDRDDVIQEILAKGLKENVRWLGTMPHEKVIAELNKADAFILACKIAKNGDRDGIPNVLVESLAMGLPVVATNVSALPEIIINEKTGLALNPSEPTKMAEALIRILTDQNLRKNLIRNGKQHVQANFNNKKLIKQLSVLYKHDIPQLDQQLTTKDKT